MASPTDVTTAAAADDPDTGLRAIRALRDLVTDTVERLVAQVSALGPLVAAGELVGTHLEGPWLSAAYCGAHDPRLLRDATPEDAERPPPAAP